MNVHSRPFRRLSRAAAFLLIWWGLAALGPPALAAPNTPTVPGSGQSSVSSAEEPVNSATSRAPNSASSAENSLPPQAVSLSVSSLPSLKCGESTAFTVLAAKETAVSGTSKDSAVAQIQVGAWDVESGGYPCTVKGLSAGTTVLTVTGGAQQFQLPVTVVKSAAKASLWLDTASYTFKTRGQSYTVLIRTPSKQPLQAVSTNPETVAAAQPVWSDAYQGYLCKLTAGAQGKASVRFTQGDAETQLPVQVTYQPAVITRDTYSYRFCTPGQQYVLYARASNGICPWVTSENPDVVQVVAQRWSEQYKGYLFTLCAGTKAGTTAVSITAGSTTVQVPITLELKPTALAWDTASYTFQTPGQQYVLLAKAANGYSPWVTSGDSDVVQIAAQRWSEQYKGYLFTLRAGTKAGTTAVSITAGSTTVQVPITLELKPVAIRLDTASYTDHYRGQNYTLLAVVSDSAVPAVITSSNPAVVSVQVQKTGNGRYLARTTALQNGSAQIVVKAGGSCAVMPITVDIQPIWIHPSSSSFTFSDVNQRAVVTFSTAYRLPVAVSTANSHVVQVKDLGWNGTGYRWQLVAVGAGSTAVTARIGNAASVQVRIQVSTPLQRLRNEMLVRAQRYHSDTSYLILVDTASHRVGIYHAQGGKWQEKASWACTNGAPATPTVKGEFRVQNRGYFFDSGSIRCFYFTQFYGNYLFHSVLYQRTATPQRIADGRLGMALSHGCVRLSLENAKWIYSNIPRNTKVVVY